MARHRARLEQLLDVSSTLTASQSTDEILRTVCRGIHSALGFQKVSIELVETETGMLRSRAAAGWDADDPAVLRPLPFDPVRELFDPAFEVSGRYLLPNEEARKRIDSAEIKYMSQNNGRGPHAWNHHWLIVPLYDREGEAFGVIWADDPDDRLLPLADTAGTARLREPGDDGTARRRAVREDALPRRSRPAHESPQPSLVRPAARRGGRAQPAVQPSARAARVRSQRAEGAQRHVRARGRRRGAPARRSHVRPRASGAATTRSASAATSSPSS